MTVLVCLALAARSRRHMIIVVLCLVCCVRGQSIWEIQWLSVRYEATYISQMAQWDRWLSRGIGHSIKCRSCLALWCCLLLMQQVHVESNCCTANIHAAPETVTLLECAPSSHAPKGGQKGTLPADDVSVHLRLLEHSTPHWWAAAGWERQGAPLVPLLLLFLIQQQS